MAAILKGYMNISKSCEQDAVWEPWWAELRGSTIELHDGPPSQSNGNKMIPRRSLPIEYGVDLKPAALETGKVLAFKLVHGENLMAVIEPQNIEDMGKWVSNIFKIIQEVNLNIPKVTSAVAKVHALTPKETSNTKSIPTPRQRSKSFDEPDEQFDDLPRKAPIELQRSVSVRDLRKVFEIKQEEQVPFRTTRLERSKSMSSVNTMLTPVATEHAEPVKRERAVLTRSESISCWKGPYLDQQEEKEILEHISNPYLVRLKIRRRERTIASMKATIDEIVANIKMLEDELAASQVAHDITTNEDSTEGKNSKHARATQEWLESKNSKIQVQIQAETERIEALSAHVYELQNELEELNQRITIQVNAIVPVKNEAPVPIPKESQVPIEKEVEANHSPDVHHAVPIFQLDESDSEEDMSKPEWARRAKRISRVWTTLVQDDRLP